jgi:hypothetical protein
MKDKEIIQETLQELNITTPVDGVNTVNNINNNINEDTTEHVFTKNKTSLKKGAPTISQCCIPII